MNKKENEIPKTIHVGNLLRKLFDKRRIRKAALARKIGKNTERRLQYTKFNAFQRSISYIYYK